MQKNKKMIIGGVAVASCIAAGAIFAVESNESQFNGDKLQQNDYAYMSHVAKYNIQHKTKADYKMRQARWEKVDAEIKAHNTDP
jgi:succinate dehydrogenase/fumarate reductase flavoprotein subunit